MMRFSWTLALTLAAASLTGCKDESGTTAVPGPGGPAAPPSAATAPATHVEAAHPNAVELGEQTVAKWRLKAKQDEPVKPGGDGAFDVTITGDGKPKAVRFWVGVQSGEGSVKAKAEEETPGNWHTHAEVPDPLPPGSKFWVEVEPAQGERFTAGFDMKM